MSELSPQPERPKSRLRVSPAFLGQSSIVGAGVRFGESRTTGTSYNESQIRENIEYLKSLKPMAQAVGSYRNLLSGESHFSNPPTGQMLIPDKKILRTAGLLDRTYPTFGGALVGPDYHKLRTEHPLERYKFYSSFDLTTLDKAYSGARWFEEVVDKASAQKISLTTKTFDHAFDSLNLYTWHPEVLAQIIQELYPKYLDEGLYNATPHFFQGSLKGVNPDHVGYVQEPLNGWPQNLNMSHSSRMGVLGGVIDGYLETGITLTPDLFTATVHNLALNPMRPYLLAR